MLFTSLSFLFFFLPSVIILYYLSPKRLRNTVLLVFSLFFYGYGEPYYLWVMVLSIFINYILGLLIDYFRESKTYTRLILFLTVFFNIFIIGYFKYSNFLIENLNFLFKSNIFLKDIVMPIGISFFTFQGLSYVIDIYRGQGQVQKNPLNVALYISFFPQLIAGPIVRYETVSLEINSRKESLDDFALGLERFILGFFKKLVIANQVGELANTIFLLDKDGLSLSLTLLGILAYSLQIYFDFSGYSDMAIGLGRVFGFHFLENFNYPYMAKSVSDFWRRWHMSLGSWFRDYVYIPLGGNRVNKSRQFFNIFAVWFLTGLWHGASWNFIIWGLYYGVLLTIEKLFLDKILERAGSLVRSLYTLFIVGLGWLIFRIEDLGQLAGYLKKIFLPWTSKLYNYGDLFYLEKYWPYLVLGLVFSRPLYRNFSEKTRGSRLVGLGKSFFLLAIFLLALSFLVNSSFNPFIYFRF